MIDLARAEPDGQPISLAEIAARSGISRRYLEQLAFLLKAAGLIRGHSGRRGGYTLARPSDEITIGHVVEATSGSTQLSECVGDPHGCIHSEFCECRPIWMLVTHEIDQVFRRYTLHDLADEEQMNNLRARASALELGTPG